MDFTPLRIRLPFGSEDEFIARYGVHVGRDGLFLATRTPKPEGTPLAFELVLSDGSPLLAGEGVVARLVTGARSGMVIRFLRLDGDGTALVERIVAARPTPEPAPAPAPAAPTWPGDPTRDLARVVAPPGLPRAPDPATTAPPAPPSQEIAPHPLQNLSVPLDEASTSPGDPTRDLVRIASVEDARVPLLRSVAPAERVLVPALVQPLDLTLDGEPEIPFHLRPTPALGIPRATEPRPPAHVHTAVTPVRGIPALGPDVVAFLASGSPDVPPPEEPVTQLTRSGGSPAPGASLPEVPPPGSLVASAPASSVENSPGDAAPPEREPAARIELTPAGAPDLSQAPEPERPARPPPVLAEGRAPRPERPPARTLFAPPDPTSSAIEVPDPDPASSGLVATQGGAAATTLRARDVAIPLPAPSTAQPVVPRPAPLPVAPPGPASEPRSVPLEARSEVAAAPGPTVTESLRSPAPEVALPTAVLGLDVGTSSARVAWIHDGRAELLSADGEPSGALPCRLARDSHGILRVQQPGETDEPLWVGSPVTLLAAHADSPAIKTLVRRWPVPVVADERGEVAFDWGGVTVTAVELVATLLRSLRAAAERQTGKSCTQAVLVVPAAFTCLQRARLREAAERAGLGVLRLLNAPTAAALAFAHGRGLARRRVLVWRMGAATCDAAVVAISGDDLDVVSSGGDGALGGVNFDEQLALALDKTARADPVRLRLRVAQAERCKQTLSAGERALVPPASDGDAVIEVTRADLELRTAALVERSLLLAQDVLRAAGLSAENLDDLVLCGGMAQVPHVRRAVETAFGKPAAAGTDPLGAPALGAALLGASLTAPATSGRSRSSVVEVLAVALEAVAPEFGHQRAFERNTRLPAEKTLTLTLPEGQPLEVQIFQGLARAPDPRSFLGLLQATGVERAGEWALHLALSADGQFQAAVTPPAGKRRALGLQVAPLPTEPEVAAETANVEADPGTRLLGGLKRLFGRR